MSEQFFISSFYGFLAINEENLQNLQKDLTDKANNLEVRGLILLSVEGYNGTISGIEKNVREYLEYFDSLLSLKDVIFKESYCSFHPFRRFKIDLRKEIITYKGNPKVEVAPETYLTPSEWHEVLTKESDFLVIDTRNDYEVAIGKFKGAIDPHIKHFSEFDKFLAEQKIPKDKKLLFYCTGGVRCEKLLVDLKEQGYKNIFQLHGGILKYMEEYPEGTFEGECYVFDHRVAVKGDLTPSDTYTLCPHCGDPASVKIQCDLCGKPSTLCPRCQASLGYAACSKNCLHHLGRRQVSAEA